MTLRILERLAEHARTRPNAAALTQVTPACAHHETVTYSILDAAVRSLAERLSHSVPPQSTVVLCMANRPEFVVAYLGALGAGLTVFPVTPALAAPELHAAVQRSGARVFVGDQAAAATLPSCATVIAPADLLRPSPQPNGPIGLRESEIGSMLLQSSGTTGRPKIVRRLGPSLDSVAENTVEALQLTAEDRILAVVPLCHSYGVEHGLLAPIFAGSDVRLCEGFDPASVSRQFAEGGVTVFGGVPFMFQALADRDTRMPDARLVYSAGGPLPRCVYDTMLATTGMRIGQLYGSTEVGSVTFNDPNASGDFDPASVGQPMRGVEIRILDTDAGDAGNPLPSGQEGHVAIAAPSMLSRYEDDDADPLTDGYFMTGDIGRLSATGGLTITGRIKLQYDVGGVKVNPLEIETLIAAYPGVSECVVVPMKISETVDRLKAVITTNHNHEISADEIRRYLRERVAPHKVPRVIEVRDILPRSPAGKVLRETLSCP